MLGSLLEEKAGEGIGVAVREVDCDCEASRSLLNRLRIRTMSLVIISRSVTSLGDNVRSSLRDSQSSPASSSSLAGFGPRLARSPRDRFMRMPSYTRSMQDSINVFSRWISSSASRFPTIGSHLSHSRPRSVTWISLAPKSK